MARLRTGRLAMIVLLAVLAVGFIALALWQVERRAWKHALVERVEQRVSAPPVEAPGRAAWPRITADDDAYRHVVARGTFMRGSTTFVRAVTAYGSGYWVLTPLRLADGTAVLVNRGFIGADARARTVDDGGSATVTGLLRVSEPNGAFLTNNDPAADRWVSRDVAAIAAARGLADVAPYFIDADADPTAASDGGVRAMGLGVPIGGLTVIAFADNHLLYAVIWALLAALCGAALVLVLRPDRPARASR